MPSLKAIRTRIASVKNTQKITRAMKLVAAARLKRAQDAMMQSRPYAKRLGGVVADLAARINATTKDFLDGKVDQVIVVFNEFKSAISQAVTLDTLLPLQTSQLPATEGRIDFEYEPSKDEVLSSLLPLYIEISLYRIMLEAIASEF